MNTDRPIHDAAFPELLAGYADGELDTSDCDRVESWLAANPGQKAELEVQRRTAELYSRPWASDMFPSEAQWSRVFRNVTAAVSTPRPIVAPAARVSRTRLLMALTAVAAAAMLAVFLVPRDAGNGGVVRPSDADRYVVATSDDVEIMRVLEADVDRLVVGEPPARRVLVLAAFEDVKGLEVVRDTDGMMPMVAMQAAVAPMVVAPMVSK